MQKGKRGLSLRATKQGPLQMNDLFEDPKHAMNQLLYKTNNYDQGRCDRLSNDKKEKVPLERLG